MQVIVHHRDYGEIERHTCRMRVYNTGVLSSLIVLRCRFGVLICRIDGSFKKAWDMLAQGPSIENILRQIEALVRNGTLYPAVIMVLTLPDICGALLDPGEKVGVRYKKWCADNLKISEAPLTPDDLYSFRCGIVHEGTFGRGDTQYRRVIWSLPNPRHNIMDNIQISIGGARPDLHLDAVKFVTEFIANVRVWYAANRENPAVKANIERVVQYYPNGFPGQIGGVPQIG